MNSRLICESCFHYLNMEMVHYIIGSEEKNYLQHCQEIEKSEKDKDEQSPIGTLPRKENIIMKLKNLGFDVGLRLVERFTKDKALIFETLETVKFICKDFSQTIFKKQFDNLRTDHRGTFALQNNHFQWLTRVSVFSNDEKESLIPIYVSFFCGLLEGAFHNLGHNAAVSANTSTPPLCTFKIIID